MSAFSIPDDLEADLALDGVLHRLLVGPATFLPNRPAIADGGMQVPPYTASIEAAARLFDARMSPAEWFLHRAWDRDSVCVSGDNGLDIGATGARGQGALALSLLTLAAVRELRAGEEWDAMIVELRELAADTEARRTVARI